MKNANLVSLAACGLTLLLLSGCDAKTPPPATLSKTPVDYFPIKVGDRTVQMQIAVLQTEMRRGLMGRRDIGPEQGMLFIFRSAQSMSFWMYDTPTPLDIGFFDATGTLLEIYPMHPFDEKPVVAHSHAIKFALEMNQNWFRDNEIKPGSKLDLKAAAVALKARDIDPQQLGLVNNLQ